MISQLFAQQPIFFNVTPDTSILKGHLVLLEGHGGWHSNALDNAFVKSFLLGTGIGEDTKENIARTLKQFNRAGGSASAGMRWLNFESTLPNRPEWGWQLSASTNYHGQLFFRRGLYELLFEGNKQFAGERVNIGQLSFNGQAYQKIGFGVFDKATFSSVTLSAVNGQQMLQGAFVGDVWTSANGDELNVN